MMLENEEMGYPDESPSLNIDFRHSTPRLLNNIVPPIKVEYEYVETRVRRYHDALEYELFALILAGYDAMELIVVHSLYKSVNHHSWRALVSDLGKPLGGVYNTG